MRVLFAGTPQLACPCLQALVDSGAEVVAVLTRPDARAGRGKKLTASPVAQLAESLGIPVWKPQRADARLVEQVHAAQVDVAAVVAFGMLLSQELIDAVPGGWINLHFSLLPRWRGAAPVQRAILAGDPTTGVTTFRIVRALDAGPVYRSLEIPIGDDTSGELLNRMADLGAPLLVDSLADAVAGVHPTTQPDEGVTIAAKLHPEDVRIDWRATQGQIDRLVRAANPAPMAWTTLGGERFLVQSVDPRSTSDIGLAPGELAADRRHLWVGTGEGAMELLEVKPAGRKPMRGADWARGRSEFGAQGLSFDA